MTRQNKRGWATVAYLGAVWAFVAVFAFLLASGCGTWKKAEAPKIEAPKLAGTAAHLDEASKTIDARAEEAVTNLSEAKEEVQTVATDVQAQSKVIREATPTAKPVADRLDANAVKLQIVAVPKIQTAAAAVGEIRQQVPVIASAAAETRQADVQAAALQKDRDDLQARYAKDTAKLKADADAWQKKYDAEKEASASAVRRALIWLIVGSVVALAGGVVLAVKVDFKTGAAVAVGALVVVGTAAVVRAYLDWLIYGAAALGAALLGLAIWYAIANRKAFLETGNLVESLKAIADPTKIKTFFADGGPVQSVVSDLQSTLFQKARDAGLIKAVTPAVDVPANATPPASSAPAASPTPAAPPTVTT
jgi:hypothetical protein